jgi:hypothetical protein
MARVEQVGQLVGTLFVVMGMRAAGAGHASGEVKGQRLHGQQGGLRLGDAAARSLSPQYCIPAVETTRAATASYISSQSPTI